MLTTPVAAAPAGSGWLADTPFMRNRRTAKERAGLAGWIGVDLLVSAELSGRSLIANGLIGIAAVVALANISRIRRLSLVTLPYLIYMIAFAVVVNSLPTTGHELYAWLNDNGRIVIAVLPLVVLGTLTVRWADMRLFIRALQVFVWVDVLLYMAALAHVQPIHGVLRKGNFFGLTSSHHAAGYFASATVLILFAARRTPQLCIRPALITILASGGLIIASGSRTSLIGLAGVAVWSLLSKRRASDVGKALAGSVAGAGALLALGSRFSNTVATFFSATFRQQAWNVFKAGLAQHESAHYTPIYGTAAGYIANILARFFYWGTAIGLFVRSPVLGIGSFRFNSINLQFTGVPYIADFATSGVDNSAQLAGAHDQYLETLVDNGIVGLVLLLMIWIVPYRALRRSPGKPQALIQSGSQMVPFAFATAFTGLTLAAPSLTFVALTWLTFVTFAPEPEALDQPTSVPPLRAGARRKSRTSAYALSGRRRPFVWSADG